MVVVSIRGLRYVDGVEVGKTELEKLRQLELFPVEVKPK